MLLFSLFFFFNQEPLALLIPLIFLNKINKAPASGTTYPSGLEEAIPTSVPHQLGAPLHPREATAATGPGEVAGAPSAPLRRGSVLLPPGTSLGKHHFRGLPVPDVLSFVSPWGHPKDGGRGACGDPPAVLLPESISPLRSRFQPTWCPSCSFSFRRLQNLSFASPGGGFPRESATVGHIRVCARGCLLLSVGATSV